MVFVDNPPRQASDGSWSVDVIDASVIEHQNDVRPGGTGVGKGTIAATRDSKGFWWINFDVAAKGDHFRPTLYTSALRIVG